MAWPTSAPRARMPARRLLAAQHRDSPPGEAIELADQSSTSMAPSAPSLAPNHHPSSPPASSLPLQTPACDGKRSSSSSMTGANPHLQPPTDPKSSRPSIKSAHSNTSSVHQQQWVPTVTLESLDNEGLLQPPVEAAADVLYRLDDDHRLQHRAHEAAVAHDAAADDGVADDDDNDEAGDGPLDAGDDRDDSVHWKRQRQQSRMGRAWWRRPNPYWLLMIQVGHAISMGSSIAPKSEIYNQLACLVHYPTTSNDASSPVLTEPALPSVPRPIFDQPSTSPAVESPDDSAPALLTSVKRSLFSSPVSSSFTLVLDGRPLDPLRCRKSPEVQKAAAQFTTVMTIAQGVLSALTTGWWGRLSDRFGRTKVMGVAMSGIIFGDIIFLATAKFPHSVPGGYRFLLIGPLFDGLLGGMPTFSATNNAYIADCTPDGTRAQIYSRIVGVLMLGLAIGPVLGSFIIARTGDVLSVFYFSTVLHSAMFLVVLLFLPESLSKAARSLLVKQAEERRLALKERDLAERQWEGTGDDDDDGADANASGWSRLTTDQAMRRSKGTARRMTRRALGFLAPLEIFLPGYAAEEDDDDATGLPTKGRKRNWNLTLLAIGYSGTLCLMGVFILKFQFIQLRFGWGPAELGPFLSAIGTIRALHLLLILPTFVRFFKPKVVRTNVSRASSPVGGAPAPDPHAAHRALHDSRFDLKVIKFSLLFDVFAYLGILFSTGPVSFLAATALTPFGGGAGPAISSLALALLPSTRIAGRLFGAMAVLQAVIATVLSPLVFGTLYAYTTASFPKAIFLLCFLILCGSLLAFSLIRIDKPSDGLEDGGGADEAVTDGAREPLLIEVERGRKRKPKPVNGSGFSLRTADGHAAAGSTSGTASPASGQ